MKSCNIHGGSWKTRNSNLNVSIWQEVLWVKWDQIIHFYEGLIFHVMNEIAIWIEYNNTLQGSVWNKTTKSMEWVEDSCWCLIENGNRSIPLFRLFLFIYQLPQRINWTGLMHVPRQKGKERKKNNNRTWVEYAAIWVERDFPTFYGRPESNLRSKGYHRSWEMARMKTYIHISTQHLENE